MRRRPKQKSTIASFLGVSLLVHLQVVLIAIVVVSSNPEGCNSASDLPLNPIEVALVSDTAHVESQKRAMEKEREQEEKEERDRNGQVVDLARPREERQPNEAKYLSEYDSSVRRETKAPAARRQPGRSAPRPAQKGTRELQRPARRNHPTAAAKLAMRTKPHVPHSRLAPQATGDEVPSLEQSDRQSRRSGAAEPLAPGALQPTQQELTEAIGGGSIDALIDVDEGTETLLNSRRWRFASFFNRIKQQVAQNWHPDREYLRRDPTGNVYGFKDRLTILRVKLTPRGELKGMHLEKASGLAFLDGEAMNAFRLAEPFPNPPRGLVDEQTGLISFRFGFLFELSRRPSFRILRFGSGP